MRAVSSEALAVAADHRWENTTWSGTATAILAYTELLRAEPTEAERLSAQAQACETVTSSPPAPVRPACRPRRRRR